MNHCTPSGWWRPGNIADRGNPLRADATGESEGRDSALPFWALMSFTFILLIMPQGFFPALASLHLALLTGALAMIAYLVDRFIHGQPIMTFTREMRITGCLVGWAILTVPLSYWPGGSISFLFEFYFKTLVIFWLLSNIVNTPRRLRYMAWGLSLMAAPLAFTGVNEYRLGNFLSTSTVTRIVGYEAPLTGNPNDLALMLNLILPLSVALFLISRNPIVRLLLLAFIALDVIAVVLTFSRAGFLTLAMIFVTYLWKFRNRPGRSWLVAALVIAALCIPLLLPSYSSRLATITDIEADSTGSAEARWNYMVSAGRFVLRNPIVGAGVGMGLLALNEMRGAHWAEVHNVYLQYAVDLGVPGLVLFLLLLVGSIKCAAFVRLHSTGVPAFRELFFLSEGIEVSLIAFSVAALFSPVAYHFYFYYLAGLSIGAKAIYEVEQRNARSWKNNPSD